MGSVDSYLRSTRMYLYFQVPSRVCWDDRWFDPPSGWVADYGCYINMSGLPSAYYNTLTHTNFIIKEAPGKTKVNKWII